MKGIWVLFHMRYCSLVCSKEWLSDTPKWRGCLQTPEVLTVQISKHNNPVLMWKWEFPRLSAYHLAVSWSWTGYHTSFERGHSGLPADMKIRTVIQLIGILWSYFEYFWGVANILNILVCHLPISHRCQGYHTSFERKDKELSFNPNCLHITCQISFFWLHS